MASTIVTWLVDGRRAHGFGNHTATIYTVDICTNTFDFHSREEKPELS